jgi:hypothetical protein
MAAALPTQGEFELVDKCSSCTPILLSLSDTAGDGFSDFGNSLEQLMVTSDHGAHFPADRCTTLSLQPVR